MEQDLPAPVPPEASKHPISRTYLSTNGYGRSDQAVDRHEIRAFLLRRRGSILGGFLSLMIAATAITFLIPRTYESSASFLVEQQGVGSDLAALDILDRMGRLASRETEAELIQSRRVVEPVVDVGDLHVDLDTPEGPVRPSEVFEWFEAGTDAVVGTYELSQGPDGRWMVRDARSGDLLASGAAGTSLEFAGLLAGLPVHADGSGPYSLKIIPFAEAVEETQDRLEVEPAHRDADLLLATCSGPTAVSAQWLCGAITDSYIGLRSKLQHAEASAAAEFLTAQTAVVERRLRNAEDSLRTYARLNQAVALETRAAQEVVQNASLWAQREQLRAERASLAALISQIEQAEGGSRRFRDLASFPTFLTSQNQMVPGLVASLVDLENRRIELAVRRSEKDVELAALDGRIEDVESQLRAIATGYEQALAAQISSLDRALENSGVMLSTIPVQQIEIARLERQVSLLEDLYGFLQSRRQEAEIAEAVELPSVRVVDIAYLPFTHSSPNRPLNLALAFVLASGFGLMLGFWRESTDTRIRERKWVEQDTGIPVLSMVPGLKNPEPVISVRLPGTPGQDAVVLKPKWNPERELALEAFRTLSADLGFVGKTMSNGGIRSLVVTSSRRGEGKTFTACNLAIVRASHGFRTLLIDGDLRGRGASQFFHLLDVPGLSELVTSEARSSDVIRRIEVGAGNKLFFLPAGASTSHSAEVLGSETFRQFLADVEEDFDLVVIDTPPLNVVTDAAAVASKVDASIVVARGGMTDRSALDMTLERLKRAGARTAGIVLNDVELPYHYRTYSHEA